MGSGEQKSQRRYSPEVRRKMILDHTAEIVNKDGISNLSMEGIGKSAGISKSLMYKYFDSLTDLLQELLERELKLQRKLQFDAAERASTFGELVRNITHQYLLYIDERGLIIERLQSEPSISQMNDPTDYGRKYSVDYLATIVSNTFDIPPKLARAVTDVSFGLPAAAGQYLLRGEMTLEEVEELTVTMIISSLVAVKDDYDAHQKKLVR